MRIAHWAAGLGIALVTTGCADRFRRAALEHATVIQAAHGAQQRLLVSALPGDLSWLADGLKLYREIGRTATPTDDTDRRPAVDWLSVVPSPDLSPGTRADTAESSPDSTTSSAAADVRFVTLPLPGDTSRGLATVPSDLEATVAPAILPLALQAARSGGRTVALPVAARWIALAYDPAHLEESPSPVPPNLEAWVEQLRALHRRRPEHPPLIAAWDESRIASSFALLLAANGGRLLDDAGQPAFSSPEGVTTVELMSQMLAEGLVQPTALGTDTHRLAAALSGPYAYWLCPSDALDERDGPGPDRLAALRVSGLPVAAGRYHYPEAVSVVLAQFRGVAVADGSPRAAAAWRLARFLADPVVLRSAPPAASVLAAPPPTHAAFIRQVRALSTHVTMAPWPKPPGMNELLGKFLHAALRRTLTPREALERAALQIARPGALPSSSDATAGAGGAPRRGGPSFQEPGAAGPNNPGPGSSDKPPGEPSSSSPDATSESAAAAAARAHETPSAGPASPGQGPGPAASDPSRSVDFGPSARPPAARP